MRTKKGLFYVLIASVLLAVGFRIALPRLITRQANGALDRLPGYRGSVEDIDLALIRCAYTIHGVSISKEGDGAPVPFLSVDRTDVSLEWGALLHGNIVAKVLVYRPQVNFTVDADKEVQDGRGVKWLDRLQDLTPIRINRFEMREGSVHFRDYSTRPRVDIFVESLYLLAWNISNVVADSADLPSSLEMRGRTVGGGRISASGRFNALRQVPEFDADFTMEDARLVALNDFLRSYANVSAEAGTFSVFTEATLKDGRLRGYVKPFFTDITLVDWSGGDESLGRKIWESVVGAVKEILENPEGESVGARVPFEGRFTDPSLGIWTGIWTLLRNALVEALSKELEYTIEFNEGP